MVWNRREASVLSRETHCFAFAVIACPLSIGGHYTRCAVRSKEYGVQGTRKGVRRKGFFTSSRGLHSALLAQYRPALLLKPCRGGTVRRGRFGVDACRELADERACPVVMQPSPLPLSQREEDKGMGRLSGSLHRNVGYDNIPTCIISHLCYS